MQVGLFVAIIFLCCVGALAKTTTWGLTGGGDWSTATNWVGGLPEPGDTVNIGVASGTVTANVAVNIDRFNLTGGTIVVFNGATIINVATVAGSATLDSRSSAGTVINQLVLAGTTTAGAKLFISSTSFVNITQSFAWAGTSSKIGSSTTTGSGTLNLGPNCVTQVTSTGTGVTISFVTVRNYGYVDYAASIAFSSNAQFRNEIEGVFNATSITTSNITIGGTTTGDFYNYGSMIISRPAGYGVVINTRFHNNGQLTVNNGNVEFFYQGIHNGVFSHAVSAFIRFSNGFHQFLPSSVVSEGPGIVFSGASSVISGSFLPTNFLQTGTSNTTFAVRFTTTETITANSGQLIFLVGADITSLVVLGGATVDFRGGSALQSLSLQGTSTKLFVTNTATTVTVATSFRWSGTSQVSSFGGLPGGTLQLLATCASTFDGAGSAQYLNMVTLRNAGHVTYLPLNDGIRVYPSAAFYNELGAVMNVTTTQVSPYNVSMGVVTAGDFYNEGTLNINLPPYYSFKTSVRLHNRGTLVVNGGSLEMRADGTHSGTFIQAPGSSLVFALGAHTLTSTSVVQAEGTVIFNGATTTIGGNFLPPNFFHWSGTTIFTSTYTTTESLTINGGVLNFTVGANIHTLAFYSASVDFRGTSAISTLELLGAPSRLFISGALAAVNVSQTLRWSGTNSIVTATGAPTVGGTLNLAATCRSFINGLGTAQYISYSTVRNYGYMEYGPLGDGVELNVNGQFRNEPGAIFNVTSAAGNANVLFGATATGLYFVNNGTIAVNLPSVYTFMLSAPFHNGGQLQVNSGVTELSGNGLHTGNFFHQPGAGIRFVGGAHTLTASSSVAAGTGIVFNGATTEIRGTFNPTTFQQLSGNTTFSIPFTTTSALTVVGGNLIFHSETSLGAISINQSATLDFRGPSNVASSVELLGTSGAGGKLFITTAAAMLNITSSLRWTGLNCQISIGSGPTGGRLNLLPSCSSIFSGSGTSQLLGFVTVSNYGNLQYSATGDGVELTLGGQFRNELGGVFQVEAPASTSNTSFGAITNTLSFTNAGQLNVNVSSGYAFKISSLLHNEGVVNVVSGALLLAQSGTAASVHSGTFNHQPGTSIRFFSGVHTLAPTSVVSDGAGVVFEGATTTIQGNFVPALFQHTSGTTTFAVAFDNAGSKRKAATTEPLSITGGTLNFNVASSLYSLVVTGGSATVVDFKGGVSTIRFVQLLGTSSKLYITGSSTSVNVTEGFHWGGSNFQLSTSSTVGGTLNLQPSAVSYVYGGGTSMFLSYITLSNYGTLYYNATGDGVELVNTGGAFRNEIGGLMIVGNTAATDVKLSTASTSLIFYNDGTLVVSLPQASFFRIYSKFQNSGIVNATSGSLELRDGGVHTGTFDFDQSLGAVRFQGGTHTLASSVIVQNGTGLIFTGATTTIQTTNFPPFFQHFSGVTTFSVPYISTASLLIAGGTVAFTNTATLNSVRINSTMNFQAGTSTVNTIDLIGSSCNLYVSNTATRLNVTNALNWGGSNCDVSASGTSGGILTLMPTSRSVFSGSGTSQSVLYITISNYGHIQYIPAGNGMALSTGSSFRNELGGIFNVSGSSTIDTIVVLTSSYFYNLGILWVSLPTSYNFKMNARFQNEATGVVVVRSGSLELGTTSSVTHTGVFNHTTPTGKIKVMAGTQVFATASVINEGGGIMFGGGTTTLQGHFKPTSFQQVGGTTNVDVNVASLSLCSLTLSGGTLNILGSVGTTALTTLTGSGGSVVFTNPVSINQLQLKGTSTARFSNTACVTHVLLSESSTLTVGTGAQVNVNSTFTWTGTGTAKVTATATSGELNLLPSCISIFNSSSTTQPVQFAQINNYGYVDYSPGNVGVTLSSGAIFRNHPEGILNATRLTSDTIIAGSSHVFYNYGTLIISLPSSLAFRLNTIFWNYGHVHVGSGQLNLGSTATQVTGTLNVGVGGRLFVNTLSMLGGVLEGSGTVSGTLTQIGGVVRPGGKGAVGALTLTTWTQQANAVVEIETTGTTSTTFDRVDVTTATLAGQLTLSAINNYNPIVGATYAGIISAGTSVTGTFARFSANSTLTLNYLATQVDVSVAASGAPFTCSGCQHGDCVAMDTCRCYEGYTGPNCDQFSCSSPCGNGGTCTGPNQCTCTGSFVGFNCSTAAPISLMLPVWCFAGCTDPLAANYDPMALYDDGSCLYLCANSTCISPPPDHCDETLAIQYTTGYCIDDYTCDYNSVQTECSLIGQLCEDGFCISPTTGTTGTTGTTTGTTTTATTANSGTGATVPTTSATTAGATTTTATATTATPSTLSTTGSPLATTHGGTTDNINDDSSNNGTDIALPVGIAVGVTLLAVACCALVAFFLIRRRKQKNNKPLESIDLQNLGPTLATAPTPNMSYQPIGIGEKPLISSNVNNNAALLSGWTGDIDFTELTFGQKIGAGAFGVVYSGKWRGTTVAIKVMSATLSEQARYDFQQEASIMKSLRPHPNVVQFLGTCVSSDGTLCLVQQFCKEGSLYNLLHSDKKIPNEILVRIVKDITAGMMHLHAEKIVHRDLAARNVLLSENFEPKVADFGMSRVAVTSVSATTSEVGPLKYMAPESLLRREYSEKSDVWAWAITIWEIFTRQDPYPEWTAVETATRVCQMVSPYVLPPPSTMSADMMKLYLVCLSFNADDRPTFKQISTQLDCIPTLFAQIALQQPTTNNVA